MSTHGNPGNRRLAPCAAKFLRNKTVRDASIDAPQWMVLRELLHNSRRRLDTHQVPARIERK
jgi:hypothetical protein